jgi:Zn-dependent protease
VKSVSKVFLFLLLSTSFNVQTARAHASGVVDLIMAYSVLMVSAIGHEAGHAAAMKALYDEDSELNVGAFSPGSDTVLKVGKVNFKFPLMPYGYVELHNYGKDDLKDIAIGFSGPILGSITSLVCLKALETLYPSYYDFKLAKGFAATGVWAHYLNLIPHPGFDGDFIWRSFQRWQKKRNKISNKK